MIRKTPSDFDSHDSWLIYVKEEVPPSEQPYAYALGRMELYRRFYMLRNSSLPPAFEQDMIRIEALDEPERTTHLECMNDWIFAQMIETLGDEAHGKNNHLEDAPSISQRQRVASLREFLKTNNPYFGLWIRFKETAGPNSDGQSWEDYVAAAFGYAAGDELAFARAMSELERLLVYFRDSNLPLPNHFFGRVWFLHLLREPERMMQTRALLNAFATETSGCASA